MPSKSPRASGNKPTRTATAPEGAALPAAGGLDLVTAIRELGGTTETPLLASKTKFSLGSSASCDVVIASSYVSSLHALMDRRGQRIRVHDQESRNGTFFVGRRETTFDVGPGDVFTAATTQLLVLNEEMRLQRPMIAEIVGFDRNSAVDDALVAAVRGGPLALIGEAGTEQGRLAEAIHKASRRRKRPLVPVLTIPSGRAEQRQILDQAERGTLVLEVMGEPIDESFLSMMLSATYHLRVLVIAPTLAAAARSLGLAALSRFGQIELRPLRDRTADVPALLDRLLLEHGTSLCFSDLSGPNRSALQEHGWPGNLDELREAAARIAVLADCGSANKAATALGISRTTLRDWIGRLGLTMPLVG